MRGEERIAEIGARQCGVVARRQLLAAGIHRLAIDRLIRNGYLHPAHRGVYYAGLSMGVPGARQMAAALACGPGAFVSHRDAALIHRLLPDPADPGPVHVTVTRDCGRRPGIAVHRVKELPPGDVGTLGGIPVTNPVRTLVDLAAIGSDELERAIAEAQARGLVTEEELRRCAHGRRGAKRLAAVLRAGPSLTRSEAERKLLRLVRAASLPSPQTNVRLCGFEVDALWTKRRVVAEVDGYAFHRSRAAFERDRERDARLVAAGYRVVRFTWRQLVDRPETVVARLAAALASR